MKQNIIAIIIISAISIPIGLYWPTDKGQERQFICAACSCQDTDHARNIEEKEDN